MLRVAPVALIVSNVSSESFVVLSVSSRAVRQAWHSQNAWAQHVERVKSSHVETWRAKWNLGLSLAAHRLGAVLKRLSVHHKRQRKLKPNLSSWVSDNW